jgi:hypothetical protein
VNCWSEGFVKKGFHPPLTTIRYLVYIAKMICVKNALPIGTYYLLRNRHFPVVWSLACLPAHIRDDDIRAEPKDGVVISFR